MGGNRTGLDRVYARAKIQISQNKPGSTYGPDPA